jgi:hypothetical protein
MTIANFKPKEAQPITPQIWTDFLNHKNFDHVEQGEKAKLPVGPQAKKKSNKTRGGDHGSDPSHTNSPVSILSVLVATSRSPFFFLPTRRDVTRRRYQRLANRHASLYDFIRSFYRYTPDKSTYEPHRGLIRLSAPHHPFLPPCFTAPGRRTAAPDRIDGRRGRRRASPRR